MFEFAWPWVWLLAPLPLVAYGLLPRHQKRDAALLVPFFDTLKQTGSSWNQPLNRALLQKILVAAIWLLCVAAAARPQWLGEPETLPTAGRNLLLAVDLSGSMDIADMEFADRPMNRLEVVKHVIGDFVERRTNDRMGLVLFGTRAYLQAPLTFDRHTVKALLEDTQIGFAGPRTAIGDAMAISIKRLREHSDAESVIILLTDGANNSGEVDPREAANLASTAGIRIHTIGMGADEMVQQTIFGPRTINPTHDLDSDTLIYIAEQTGGAFFRARNTRELVGIYRELDKLEPIEQDDRVFRPVTAWHYWPLSLALLLSFLLSAGATGLRFRQTSTPTSKSHTNI